VIVVAKIGSSSVTDHEGRIDESAIEAFCAGLAGLRAVGQGKWRLVQLRGAANDVSLAPVAGVCDEPDEEGLPAEVHVLEVAVLLELARGVPRPNGAPHGGDADVAASHVVAVFRVGDHG